MRILIAVPLMALLMLAQTGCSDSPPPIAELPPPPPPPSLGPARGIDLATDASDVLNELQDGRLDFIARYYRDPSSRWPPLSGAEVHRLSALGLKIVAVWESHSANPANFSYASGYRDAVIAAQEARSAGQPADSAIYFAVDFNARGDELQMVDQYFTGVAAGLAAAGGGHPSYKIGVYGSGAVCDAVKQAGLARYAWLTNSTAWDGVSGYQGWNIRQHREPAALSFSNDRDEAVGEYGGFRLAAVPAAPADATSGKAVSVGESSTAEPETDRHPLTTATAAASP